MVCRLLFLFLALFVLKCELYLHLTGSQSTTQACDSHTPQATLSSSGDFGVLGITGTQTGPNTSPDSREKPYRTPRSKTPEALAIHPLTSGLKRIRIRGREPATWGHTPEDEEERSSENRVCLATHFSLAPPHCVQTKTGRGPVCLAADRNYMETV